MDFWSTIAIGVQILLLIAGWLLFQQAKSDLTARAAEAPVLLELRALEQTSRALIDQLRNESGEISERLELQCSQAIAALNSMERQIQTIQSLEPIVARPIQQPGPPAERLRFRRAELVDDTSQRTVEAVAAVRLPKPDPYALAKQLAASGLSAHEIANKTGITEGEVELIFGLSRTQGTHE